MDWALRFDDNYTGKLATVQASGVNSTWTIRRFPAIIGEDRIRSMTPDIQPNNPLHGITLEMMLTQLVDQFGWRFLSDRVAIRCFYNKPTIKSSLHFLRRTPWAREKVENLYLEMIVHKK